MSTTPQYKAGQWGHCEPTNENDRKHGIRCIVDRTTNHDVAECKTEHAALIAAAPDMLAALREAATLVKLARLYFPKSVKKSDRPLLENVGATIDKAINTATKNTNTTITAESLPFYDPYISPVEKFVDGGWGWFYYPKGGGGEVCSKTYATRQDARNARKQTLNK
jgi:hypothetical protein